MLSLPALFSTASRLLAGAALAAAMAVPASASQGWPSGHWVATWGASPGTVPANARAFSDQTLRLIVRTSIGGNRVRIRLSNEMGTTPLHVGEAHIAVRASGAEIAPGTDRPLTFSGQAAITIPPGAPVLSDPVELNVAPLSELAVSIYLPDTVTSIHGTASQPNYVSLPGNFTGSSALPTERTILTLPFLTQVDVDRDATAAIVTFGDAITGSTRNTADADGRWPSWLAKRLQSARDSNFDMTGRLGMVERGIIGARLLSRPAPDEPSALERFDREVLATAGVRYMIVLIGINDIGASPNDNPVGAQDLIAGYRQLVARAHQQGIAVYGATLTPFEGAPFYSAAKEQVRQTVNDWIRTHEEFDGVLDFDAVTRDPARPTRLLPAYDSGDHLHPNDLGHQAMGKAVPLELFRSQPAGGKR
ncbi:SGNH/GDSL hydrolase family protein [Massilia horti]|uniref:SGNH/GDSL hydrolase family protein n=1 Tax=Massilia horti TaxID=2562153 RepID=A0A4Y9SYH9_9BURK|nr:SGNH/GDSL hydrolase family protein [Massilia horti]TFW31704.1 SGNH/GDSL hydrolase family protein [Massilia horti]